MRNIKKFQQANKVSLENGLNNVYLYLIQHAQVKPQQAFDEVRGSENNTFLIYHLDTGEQLEYRHLRRDLKSWTNMEYISFK